MKRPGLYLLSFITVLTLIFPNFFAGASFPAAVSGSRFVRVQPEFASRLAQLGLQPLRLEDYGAFLWLELTPGDFQQLQARLPGQFEQDLEAGSISVAGYRFDPITQGEPKLPASLLAESSASGFHLVQLAAPVKDAWLAALQQTGAEVLQYYPNYSYLVWATESQAARIRSLPQVRWSGAFHTAYRIAPGLSQATGLLENVAVTFYNDGSTKDILDRIRSLGGEYLQHFPAQPDGRFYTALFKLDAARLVDVARITSVWAVELASPRPAFDDENGAQIIAGNTPGGTPATGYYTWLADKGVDGSGITWADVDTGLNAAHPDITGRAVAFVSYAGAPAANTDPDGHGSHTAGAIMGDGKFGTGITDPNGFYWGTGAAPESTLVVQNALMGSSWPPAGGWQVLSRDSVVNGAMGSSNSWFTGASGAQGYSSAARTHDLMVRDANFDTVNTAEPIAMVFSAGNNGPNPSTITEPKEAKNLIVVGASANYPRILSSINDIAYFSSRGPALDGRLLPNVMAPGYQTSSFNGSGANCGSPVAGSGSTYYNYCSGTSMAAPFVSGSAALIADWWGQEGRGVPSPAMIKALLINGASDMAGGSDGNSGIVANIPNNNQGWGRVNLNNVIRTGVPSLYYDQSSVFHNTGETWSQSFGVADPTKPLKISLVWSDAPGAVGANPALVNNLDLTVQVGSTAYRGNRFSAGWSMTGGAADVLNNIENVYVQNPAGGIQVTVQASNVAGDGVPYNGDATDQDFALVCTNCAQFPDFTLLAEPASQAVCAPAQAGYSITVGSILNFSESVTLSTAITPASPLSSSFNTNPVTPPGSSTLTIGSTGAAAPGSYTIDVFGVAASSTHTSTVQLAVYNAAPGTPSLLTPSDNQVGAPARPTFTWSASSQAAVYLLEVASDSAFSNPVISAPGLTTTSYTPDFDLNTSVRYYWRVTAANTCGSGSPSQVFSFVTLAAPGDCNLGSLPVAYLQDNFESGAPGWTHDGTGDSWALSSVRTRSGLFSYHADDPAVASDQRLYSPPVSLPTGAGPLTLQFWNYQVIEDRSLGGCYDGGLLEISTDNGTTWNQVLNPGLLTDPYDGAIAVTSNPLYPKDAWCGDPQDWLKSVAALDAYAGQTVRFRFRLGSDASVSREGWYIDDVVVQGCVLADYDASLAPAASTLDALPGSLAVHQFTLNNLGLPDTYSLTLEGSVWPTSLLTPAVVALGTGQSAQVEVRVSVPPAAPQELLLGSDSFTLTVRSNTVPTLDWASSGTTRSVINPALTLTPPAQSAAGEPGELVNFTFTLANTGDFTDTIGLGLSGYTWPSSAPPSVILGPGKTAPVAVQVEIPLDLPMDVVIASDIFTLTATSGWAPEVSVSAKGTTNANVTPAVIVTPAQGTMGALPGSVVTHTIQVRNTGTYTDNLALSITGNQWSTLAPINTGPLAPDAQKEILVRVTIPTLLEKVVASDSFTLSATSQWDSSVSDTYLGTSEARVEAGVLLSPAAAAQSGAPGEVLTYTFMVTNTGDYLDSIQLTVSGNLWATTAPANTGPLAPAASQQVQVLVTIPSSPILETSVVTDSFQLKAASQWDDTMYEMATVTSTTSVEANLALSPPNQTKTGAPGTQVALTYLVTNTGTISDQMVISLQGSLWPTQAPAATGILAPGGSQNVTVLVDIPATPVEASVIASDQFTLTVSSGWDAAVAAQASGTVQASADLSASLGADQTGSAVVGTQAVYLFVLSNTGTYSDTYMLQAAGGWPASLSESSSGLLGPGESFVVSLTVEVPLTAVLGSSETVTVSATSGLDAGVSAQAAATTTAVWRRLFLPVVMR